jgi:hypothetical protein
MRGINLLDKGLTASDGTRNVFAGVGSFTDSNTNLTAVVSSNLLEYTVSTYQLGSNISEQGVDYTQSAIKPLNQGHTHS